VSYDLEAAERVRQLLADRDDVVESGWSAACHSMSRAVAAVIGCGETPVEGPG
jgi:hypothetical protein